MEIFLYFLAKWRQIIWVCSRPPSSLFLSVFPFACQQFLFIIISSVVWTLKMHMAMHNSAFTCDARPGGDDQKTIFHKFTLYLLLLRTSIRAFYPFLMFLFERESERSQHIRQKSQITTWWWYLSTFIRMTKTSKHHHF